MLLLYEQYVFHWVLLTTWLERTLGFTCRSSKLVAVSILIKGNATDYLLVPFNFAQFRHIIGDLFNKENVFWLPLINRESFFLMSVTKEMILITKETFFLIKFLQNIMNYFKRRTHTNSQIEKKKTYYKHGYNLYLVEHQPLHKACNLNPKVVFSTVSLSKINQKTHLFFLMLKIHNYNWKLTVSISIGAYT